MAAAQETFARQHEGVEEDVKSIAELGSVEVQRVIELWAELGTAAVQGPGDVADLVRGVGLEGSRV
jgi:hypothetical protein